ncbi:hypothetical protein OAT92_09775 [Porticoccaceae bacterium]|nr:hypothetical protein [Porticoccaceae bacterium]
MIRPIVGKGFLPRIAPRGRSALVCVLKADDVVDVDEVTGLVGVKAYGGIGFVATIVKVFAVIAVCKGH